MIDSAFGARPGGIAGLGLVDFGVLGPIEVRNGGLAGGLREELHEERLAALGDRESARTCRRDVRHILVRLRLDDACRYVPHFYQNGR